MEFVWEYKWGSEKVAVSIFELFTYESVRYESFDFN